MKPLKFACVVLALIAVCIPLGYLAAVEWCLRTTPGSRASDFGVGMTGLLVGAPAGAFVGLLSGAILGAWLFRDPQPSLPGPVHQSRWAIAAGYLGLLSVFIVPAPFALLAGVIALDELKKHPECGGRGRAIFGIVMGAGGSLLLSLFFRGLSL